MTFEFNSTSPEQTEQFASRLSSCLNEGDVITLDGDLGAGKTCFTRGLVRGIGSADHVSSPTFTIVNEYEGGRLPVFHFDTYRLGDSEEFLASGLDEYFYRGGVSVIEWSTIISDVLPKDKIAIDITGTGNVRHMVIEVPEGDRFKIIGDIVKEI